METIILHCDLNNFYASVECREHPELKQYPIAVCGSVEDRHGIVLAKNDLAKKAGVLTAEVIWQAKAKCPNLIIVPPNMDKYISISKKVRKIYSDYTDLIEPFGIDECWLDVSGSTLLFGNGYEIAYKIKERIKAELGLTISVGVSFNKIFAKLGSDMKKPDAITCIDKDNFKTNVWPLSANELLGVGKATYNKLQNYGINTIGEMAGATSEFLKSILGKNGEALWFFANGLSSDKVAHESASEVAKSVGNSTTANKDLTSRDEVWHVMYQLSESVTKRLREQGLLAGGIQISVKDNTLSSSEWQAPLPFYTRYPKDLCDLGISLFEKQYHWQNNVRAIGITAINLVLDNQSVQCSFLYDQEKIIEHEALEEKIAVLRKRYGDLAIQRASLLIKPPTKKEAYDQSSLPGAVFKKR